MRSLPVPGAHALHKVIHLPHSLDAGAEALALEQMTGGEITTICGDCNDPACVKRV